MWFWVVVFFGLVALLAAWPFVAERRRGFVGPPERHGAKGDFAYLSQGVTHYRWIGPTRGPVAVLIHGVGTPMIAMQAVAEGMGNMGYRVLIYDLYGRGLSDAPKGLQNRVFFLRQLYDLLIYHNLREDVTLVGYSMGGAIATAFAAENPYVVKRIILLASAGIVLRETRFTRFCRKTPVLGDWVHAMFVRKKILAAIPERGRTPETDAVLRAQRREVLRRGYLPALLSSRRGMLAETQEKEHRQLGRQGVPVIAVWGGADRVIPLAALGLLALWNRSARQEVIDHADHGLPYTHAAQVIAAVRAALQD